MLVDKIVRSRNDTNLGDRLFPSVIPHVPAMMLGHAKAESALESSWITARDGIALLPSECLRAFLQHLQRGHGFVRVARFTWTHLGHMHHTVLQSIHTKGVGHFVDHDLPRPLRFLLEVTPV